MAAVHPAAASAAGPVAAVPAVSSADGLEDADPPEVFVESTWRTRRVRYDREQQSEDRPGKDAAVQSKTRRTGGYQTESTSTAALSADALLPAGFGPFLSAAYPVLSAQLESNARSHAFDDYLVAWEEEREGVENLFKLCHQQAMADLSRPEENAAQQSSSSSGSKSKQRGATRSNAAVGDPSAGGSVLGLSWSCNGSVLAASYGRSDHIGWCNHASATLAFWNIMRRQIDLHRPDFQLDTGECCCMCVAYHPERPTIIAGGMFNGEIRIWDTSLLESTGQSGGSAAAEEDSATPASSSTAAGASTLAADAGNPLLMRSRIDDYFHREPIARLEWIRDPLSRVWSLVSVAGDGKVLFWSLEADNKLRYPTEGYTLSPSEKWDGHHHASSSGVVGLSRNKFHVLGGTAVAFGPQTSATSGGGGAQAGAGSSSTGSGGGGAAPYFVAATEGGGLVRVNLSIVPKRKGYLAKGAGGDPALKWSREAHRFLENSDPASRFDLRKAVEKFVKLSGGPGGNGSAGDSVELEHIFLARPPVAQLYPSAVSAVTQSFESHAGPVYGLAFNSFDRRIFASASTDGRIKVFHIQHSKPLLTLESGTSDYLFSLVWSPVRPLVFAVSDGSGSVRLYDLLANMMAPVLSIAANDDRTPVQCLVFNAQEPSLLACADVRGRINVFNLAGKYAQMQPGERRLLEQMGAMSSQA